MKIDIGKAYAQAEEFDLGDGVKFKIRPFPASREKFSLSNKGEIVFHGEHQLEKFLYCLVGWEGVTDADGNPLRCTDDVKTIIYENKLGDIPSVVLSKVREMEQARAEAEKN